MFWDNSKLGIVNVGFTSVDGWGSGSSLRSSPGGRVKDSAEAPPPIVNCGMLGRLMVIGVNA